MENGLEEKKYKFLNLSFAFVLFLVLMILTTFRGINVGNDTRVYVGVFNNYCNGIETAEFLRFEPGFQFINIITSHISNDPQAIIIVTSIICYLLIGIFCFKFVDNKLFFMVLFFCLLFPRYTNIIRQAIAMSILIYAYLCCEKNKTWMAIILTLLAMTIHSSSAVFLIYIFIKNIKLNKIAVYSIIIVTIFSCLFANDIILNLFLKVTPEYESHLSGDRVGSGQMGVTLNLIILLTLFLIYFLPRRRIKLSNQIIWLFVICGIFTLLSYIMNNFMRVAYIFYLPIIKECSSYVRNKKNYVIYEVVGALWMLVIFILIVLIRPEWNILFPYHFY